MEKYFRKSALAATIALAGILCLPSVGMAGPTGQTKAVTTLGINELGKVDLSKIFLLDFNQFSQSERDQLFSQLPDCDTSRFVVPDTFDGGSARAPVWTDELGEVDLDQYTREELDQMVRDYWTRHEYPKSEDDIFFRVDVTKWGGENWTGPKQETKEEVVQRYLDYWTPERISNADTDILLSISEQYRAALNGATGTFPFDAATLPFPFNDVNAPEQCVFRGGEPAL